MTPRVVLVGLPGSGKTSTGRRLGRLLRVEFADSDELVRARTGREITEIFAEDGEPAFRALEAEVIAESLAGFDGVLALGGGAVLSASTRIALAASGVPVVLLRTGVPTLFERVAETDARPLLLGDPQARLAELAEAREPLYREVATLTVDTERRTIGRVASVIRGLLEDATAKS